MRIARLIKPIALFATFLMHASPAVAGASDRVSFKIAPKVVSQIVERTNGETKLLVASNSAFNINVTGLIGKVKITIETNGVFDGTDFGGAAQLPGHATTELFLTNAFKTPIYRSKRKTARGFGKPIEQAVLVRISYEEGTNPAFIIEPSHHNLQNF